MIFINDILYISYSELCKSGVSENTIRKAKLRKTSGWSFIKDPADSRKLLIEYEPLNDRYKEMIKDKYGDPYLKASAEIIEPLLTNDPADVEIIRHYILPSGKYLPDEEQDRYINACQYLNLLNRMRPKQIKEIGIPNTKKFYNAISFMIKENTIPLPKSYNKLRVKVREYKEHGAECVVSGKYGNNNKRKVYSKQETIINQIWARTGFSAPQTAEEYNEIAIQNGWETVCSATILNYVTANKLQLMPVRKGEKEYQDNIDFVTKRKRPHAPMIRLEGDGTPYELYYQKDGKHWHRKSVYVVIDAFNDTVLGYAVGDVENSELALAAWEKALQNCGLITPYEIKTDNFGRGALKKHLKWVTTNFSPGQPKRSRDRLMESVFGRLNKSKYMKRQLNFAGHNITAKDTGVNRERLQKAKKYFPDEETLLDQLEYIFQEWNKDNYGKKTISRYQELKQAEQAITKTIDLKSYLKAFGKIHSHKNTLNRLGLNPRINGEEIRYMNFDQEDFYIENFGKQFNILYNPNDLSKILAYTDEGDEIIMNTVEAVEMTDFRADKEDRARLGKQEIFRKNVRDKIEQKNQSEYDEVESEGILKSFFAIDGTNKAYQNAAKQRLKEPSGSEKKFDDGYDD